MNVIEKQAIEKSQLPLTPEEIKTLSHQETFRMVMSPAQMRIITDFINEECQKKIEDYKKYIKKYFTTGTNQVKKERLEKEACIYFKRIVEDLESFKKESYAYFERAAEEIKRLEKKMSIREIDLSEEIKRLEKEMSIREIDLSEEIEKFKEFDFEKFKKLTFRQKIAIYKKYLVVDFGEILLPLKEIKQEIKLSLDYNKNKNSLTLSSCQIADLRENSEVKPLYDLLQALLKTGEIQTLPSDLTL